MGATHVRSLGDALELAVSAQYIVRPSTQILTTELGKHRMEGTLLDQPSRRYHLVLKTSKTPVASMTVQVMPGCCGVIVFYNFSGNPKDVSRFVKFGQVAAQREGYGLVLYTLRSESAIIPTLDEDNEDIWLRGFHNGKTGHDVTFCSTALKQEHKKAVSRDTEGE